MGESFGQLLHQYRIDAKLKQKDLGQKVHIDGSMISRFEAGKSRPSPSTLQEIINALALQDVPREKLDQLWRAAGYSQVQFSESERTYPVVVFTQQELEKLNIVEGELLSDDIRSIIEIDQAYFSAQKAISQSKYHQARNELLSLRRQMERRNQLGYLRVDEVLGYCGYNEGRYAEAVQYYESALWSARQLNNIAKQGEILMKLGDTLRRSGGQFWEVAHERYSEAKDIFESQHDRIRVADCLRKIACIYLYQGRSDLALPFCDESLTICQEIASERGIYKALQHKTWAYDMLGRWDEATKTGEEALTIVKQVTADEWELGAALRYLGDAYRIQRRLREAETTYREALAKLQKHENAGIKTKLDHGMCRLGLAKVYLKQPGREFEAKAYLNEGLMVHLGLGEDFRVADFLGEQGSLLLKLGRLEEADMRLQMASDRFRRLKNNFHYANTLASLCELYCEKDDFEKVYRTAETAREIDNGLINYHLARVEFFVGKAHIAEKQYAQAALAFCSASERALNYNHYSFGEIVDDILDEMDRVTREIVPEVAIQLGESYIEFWRNKEVAPAKQELVQQASEAIWQKQEKARALMPL